MKVDSSKILKEGVILKVEKIDFNDPEIKKLITISRKEQKRSLRMLPKYWTQRQWNNLRRVINI